MSSFDKLEASLDKIDGYLQSVEEYFFSSVSAVSHGLPDVHEAVNRLWVDIARYGPGLPAFPDVTVPSLGDFQVPPPPPPPSPPFPVSIFNSSVQWVTSHPKTVSVVTVGLVGAGVFYSQRREFGKHGRASTTHKLPSQSSERRQIVGMSSSSVQDNDVLIDTSGVGWRYTARSTPHSGSGKEGIYRHNQCLESRCCRPSRSQMQGICEGFGSGSSRGMFVDRCNPSFDS